MKTTLEIPDELFRATKSRAALRGESLKQFVCDALHAKLQSEGESAAPDTKPGWRKAFGRARIDETRRIDRVIEREFEQIDAEDWR